MYVTIRRSHLHSQGYNNTTAGLVIIRNLNILFWKRAHKNEGNNELLKVSNVLTKSTKIVKFYSDKAYFSPVLCVSYIYDSEFTWRLRFSSILSFIKINNCSFYIFGDSLQLMSKVIYICSVFTSLLVLALKWSIVVNIYSAISTLCYYVSQLNSIYTHF